MGKAKIKVEVKSGSQGPKISESRPTVVVTQASGKPTGKPIYKPKAKITAHITVNGKKRK